MNNDLFPQAKRIRFYAQSENSPAAVLIEVENTQPVITQCFRRYEAFYDAYPFKSLKTFLMVNKDDTINIKVAEKSSEKIVTEFTLPYIFSEWSEFVFNASPLYSFVLAACVYDAKSDKPILLFKPNKILSLQGFEYIKNL